MAVFLIWIGITGLLLAVYSLMLWRKNKKQSRFQAKLTVLFLLFILIPTIPLTLFVANVLTQSADMLILPGIGNALETSLATIRLQAEEKGRMFFVNHPDPNTWDAQTLRQKGILFTGHYRMTGDSIRVLRVIRLPECSVPHNWLPNREYFTDTTGTMQPSCMIPSNGEPLISVCTKYPDAALGVVGYAVSLSVVKAKTEITHALNVYNTMTLLKEGIIEKKLIWAIASLLIMVLALLAATSAKRLSRGISEPIQDLVEGMHRVASGDFTNEVQTQAKDEIRFLVDSFNTMTKDLQNTREKLFHSEKRAAWQEAARRISHEMRNSLTPIFISLRRIKTAGQRETLPKQFLENLKTMEEELVSLERMSAAFAEFARLPQPQKSKLDINDSVAAAVRTLENETGSIQLKTELSPHSLVLDADREQVKRMLHNLIKNAIEASGESGTVWIRTLSEENPKRIIVEIEDHGQGMDRPILDRLFEPYFTTKNKGTGLGLVIAQKIAEDHNGNIIAESEQGKGTLIRIVFKLDGPALKA